MKKHLLHSAMVKRFQDATGGPSRHVNEKLPQEVRVFRILSRPTGGLRFATVPLRELDVAKRELREAEKENTPALQAQIRDGFEAYLRGDVTPIEDFMAELEAELEEE